MSYSQDNNVDKTDFCKLGSDLVISYNGSLLECIPSTRSSFIGTVLTRTGELISRSSRCDKWESLSSPSVYLFYDNDTDTTFLVDTCIRKIKEIEPSGRILNCTDQIIYEIKDGEWVPVCDLSSHQQKTIVLVNTVSATDTSATFTFPGDFQEVDPFSEISATNIRRLGNNITVIFPTFGSGSLPSGGATVLIFTVCIDGELVTIIKIFIRQAASPQRTGARGGTYLVSTTGLPIEAAAAAGVATLPGIQTVPVTTLPINAIPAANAPPANPTVLGFVAPGVGGLAPLTGADVAAIVNWQELVDAPGNGFDPATGTITALVTGDYQITAELQYLRVFPLATRNFVPYYVLVRSNSSGVPIEVLERAFVNANLFTAPLPVPGSRPTFDLLEVGQASFDIIVRLNTGDRVRLFYIDPLLGTIPPNSPSPGFPQGTGGYVLDPLGTTFNSELLSTL